jgi:hypothetical protein
VLHLNNARFSPRFTVNHPDRIDDTYINMEDDIEGVPMTVGDALTVILYRQPSEMTTEIAKKQASALADLLVPRRNHLTIEMTMTKPVREAKFLYDRFRQPSPVVRRMKPRRW